MKDKLTLLDEATVIVRDKFLYKKFIEGTPLQNDIAVWMCEFAYENQDNEPSALELGAEVRRLGYA